MGSDQSIARTFGDVEPIITENKDLEPCTHTPMLSIDLYPLLRNDDVWGVIVGINWNMKRRRYGEQSGKVSILKEPNSCKRGQNPQKLLLGMLFSLCT